MTVYLIHTVYDDEWWQHTLFRSPTLRFNGCDLTPPATKTLPYALSRWIKHVKTHLARVPTWGSATPGRVEKCCPPNFRFIRGRPFAMPSFHQKRRRGALPPPPLVGSLRLAHSQDFSKICWIVTIWSVVLRPGWKPHWISTGFVSNISRYTFSRHLAYTLFQGRYGERCHCSWCIQSCLYFCVCGDHPSLPIFRWPPRKTARELDTHESTTELLIEGFVIGFHRRMQASQLSMS